MLPPLPLPVLIGCCTPAPPEPDGSRTLGVVPPYHGEPAPPEWLRRSSHLVAACSGQLARHYLYEAYGDGGSWLVRYVQFPGDGETVVAAQLAFLFSSDPLEPPRTLRPAEIRFEPRNARWQGRGFVLADRRDLIR